MTTPDTFLQGSFAPVTEEITAFNLQVTGQIPAELSGRYLRNGPNPLGLDEPGYRFSEGYWFLGPGTGCPQRESIYLLRSRQWRAAGDAVAAQ